MSKAITLAREAGMGGDAFGWLASNHAIEKFYALAIISILIFGTIASISRFFASIEAILL